jgi:anti-anti-sigma factor
MMPDTAYVERTEADGIVVLSAVGDFDLASVEVMRTAFGGALADHSRVVLDLGRTTFADSTALGVMVAAGKKAAEEGGWLRLVNPRPNVRKLLRVTGLDTVLGLYDTVSDALAAEETSISDS